MTRVELVEVGPRDGLQNAPKSLPPSARAELVGRLSAAGLRRFEAVSFVHPQRVPQMAGAEEVVAALDGADRDRAGGLVLNERGLDRLVASGLREMRFTFAVSDAFNRRNSNASASEGARAAANATHRARAIGLRAGVVLATSFGCPFSGEVDARDVLEAAEAMVAAGAQEIVFADTIGVAVPRQVREIVTQAVALDARVGVHLHNTRNTGYANAYVALEAGAEILDASIGGLGGCPFAPGATGNVATEDLVYMLHREGVETGTDLQALIETAEWLREQWGLALDGQLHRVAPFPPQPALAEAAG
jgi:hydroxymethylglutaryl-CoA lyase/(R)-citramalyl-CoA lyase